VRHVLNPYLARVGGHVGCAVRQRARRRGHATGLAVERALITCDQDNHGSATVIERCGGVLQDVVEDDGPQAPVLG